MATDEPKGSNGRPINGRWHPIASAVVAAILGSGGSIGVIFSTPLGQKLARPNPYTSVQAKSAHEKLNIRVDRLERHVDNHPDAALRAAISSIVADVAEGKAERRLIIANQDRILDRLDKL